MGGDGDERLLADIGGTSVRFALQRPGGRPTRIAVLETGDYPGLTEAVTAYEDRCGGVRPRGGAFCVASPVTGDVVSMTNAPWVFSISETRRALGLDRLAVVNDFTAVAHAVPHLRADDLVRIGGGEVEPRAAVGVLGPGTGLGTSGLIPAGAGWTVLEAEGGHVTMAPADEREDAVLAQLRRRFGHVSAERVVSGDGLVNLYTALADIDGIEPRQIAPHQVSDDALAGRCPICAEALSMFFAMLGTLAGNLALILGSHGGVYLAGGILPRMPEALIASQFRSRFEAKGRFRDYLGRIPTLLITAELPAFIGLAGILDRQEG
ncbi:MAG: glucokinase [Rhodospirillales bacterium]|nr:MAG: glucokinase [Rhodospirillales bacterium]